MQKTKSLRSRLFTFNNPGRRVCVLLLGAGLLLAAPSAPAAVKTWDGSSSGNWGTAANWTGGVAPVNGDDLVFPPGAANLANTNNYASLKLNSLTFTGLGYTLRGNALTVTNGISGQQAAGANTVECIVTLGAAQTFDCTTAGASQFLMGNVTNAGFLLTVSGSGSVTLGGSISGTGGVTKSGTGTLTYSGATDNLYTGPTRVTAGLLQLAKSGAVSLAGGGSLDITGATVRELANVQIGTLPVTVNAGGLLDLDGFSDTIGNSLTLNGGGDVQTGAGILYLAANNTLTVSSGGSVISGNLNVGSGTSTWNINSGITFTISANVSGSASITKTGAGGVYLDGANTFTGPLAINESWVSIGTSTGLGATNGATTINNAAYLAIHNDIDVVGEVLTNNSTYTGGALYVYGPSTNTWAGAFVLNTDTSVQVFTNCALSLIGPISGAGGITKSGPGRLSLSGSGNNTYTGDTTVNEGLLELNKSSGWAIGYGVLTIGDGVGGTHADIVRYTGASSSELNTTVPIMVNSSGYLHLNNHSDGVNGSLTLNDGDVETGAGTLSLSANSTITVSGYPYIDGRLSVGSGTCTIQGSGLLYLYANVSGTADIVKNDTVSLYLSGANTFTGTLTANNSGYLYLRSDTALGGTNGGTILNGSSSLNLWPDLNITNESLTLNSTANPTIYINSYTNTWSSTNFTLLADATIQVATNGALELIGPISGAGGITKFGPGRLIFSGSSANTYGGVTTVNEGELDLNKTVSYGGIPSAGLVIGDGTGTDTVRYLRSYQLWTIPRPVRINSSGVLDLNGFTDTASPLTLDGGQITTGSGSVWLSGTVTVLPESRTATINGNAYLFDPVVITNAEHSSSPDLQISAGISSATGNGITKTGAGEVYLTASNSFSGPVTINNGDLTIENSYALGNTNTPATVNSGGTLHVFGNLTIGAKPLVLNGPGWAGAFFVAALAVSDGNSSWAGPITNASDSTIFVYGDAGVSRSIDLSGPISGPGGLTKIGLGTNIFSGSTANTYAGTTRVNAGTLVLNKSSSIISLPGNLVVGDGSETDVVRVESQYQTANSADVLIQAGGLLDCEVSGTWINTLHGSGTVNFGSGAWLRVGVNGGTSTFDGPMTGIGLASGYTFGKDGAGTFTFNGNGTFSSGITHVYGGKLVANGSLSSAVTVDSGATLGGSGTVGEILCAGNLRPGTSAGCLTSSNLTFTSSGTFYVELFGPTPCSDYDQMIVHGTNNLANAMLNLTTAFAGPLSVGQQLILINNDGTDPITGTFLAYPSGATYAVGGYELQLNYSMGDGNDVGFTVTQVPGAVASAALTAGNGNHLIDPNECNDLSLVISNQSGAVMSGVTAMLSTTTPGVLITQPYSTYPDLASNAVASNQAPFQISTLPTFSCGTDIDLQLVVSSSLGAFTLPLVLSSGTPAVAANRYDNNAATNVPDVGTIESTNTVSTWAGGPLTKIAVSLWLVAPSDSDMSLTLIAPSGATVDLSSGNGAGANFGTGSADAQRTTFDDAAATSITAGTPPFVGTFRPEGSLASLLSSSAAGDWRLRIQDAFASGNPDTLRAWSLFLYGTTCTAGGGACALCLPPITGSITGANPSQTNRFLRNGITGSCGALKDWPGTVSGSFHYDVYGFTNTSGGDACVTVELTSSCDVQAALYLDSFDPISISNNYIADAGYSTLGGTTTFSGAVPAGVPFFVTVNEVMSGAGCPSYTLQLSGLPCPPPTLAISPAGTPNNVRVDWPTWAGGYQLEAKPTVVSGAWSNVTTEPIVSGGRYNVTNQNLVPPRLFYRLHKSE